MPISRKLIAASVLAAAVLPLASAQAAPRGGSRHFHLGYAPADATRHGPRPGRLAALVGDRESGLGFYPLPAQFRAGGRYGRRLDDARRPGDAIRYAVATEAGVNNFGFYGDAGRERHGHTVFNPVDGYGSPFFAGYYGPAGDPDAERGPFGNTYD